MKTRKFSRALQAFSLIFVLTMSHVDVGAQNRRTFRRVRFERGSSTAALEGRLAPRSFDYYFFRARAGQKVSVRLESSHGTAVFTLTERGDSKRLESPLGITDWTGQLPKSGDYSLHVGAKGGGGEEYKLVLTIQ